ncbi:hypothetical protein LK08_17660 [Streptomyces sp. MUSC 125]|uniref:hypothetical protein n=1 Tax=Streptomyces sp. MUSC 125 TaxID=1428624 RepID=UPI00057E5DD8|nr:hypothetical protein [Streptomyces sp. MUSC 125]KIE25711.1 hypothetical protein LK08_17660 [Streptomyces sp. MUSC 125]
MTFTPQAAVAVPLELLKSKTIRALTDSFQAAFIAAYDEERARKEQAQHRLLAELSQVDTLGLTVNSTAYEEYRAS